MHHFELKSSLGELVANSIIRYSNSQMSTSTKRRKIKLRLKHGYGYAQDGELEVPPMMMTSCCHATSPGMAHFVLKCKKTSYACLMMRFVNSHILILSAANMLQCMLTGEMLPSQKVIGTHIFKFCWAKFAEPFLSIHDIDDPRNGLLICKPVEEAFDTSALCFIFREETQG